MGGLHAATNDCSQDYPAGAENCVVAMIFKVSAFRGYFPHTRVWQQTLICHRTLQMILKPLLRCKQFIWGAVQICQIWLWSTSKTLLPLEKISSHRLAAIYGSLPSTGFGRCHSYVGNIQIKLQQCLVLETALEEYLKTAVSPECSCLSFKGVRVQS